MKKTRKILLIVVSAFLLIALAESCSNAVVRPRAGVDVVWGSHGPKVVPSMGVSVYGGGRY